jgi:hypothetical protein
MDALGRVEVPLSELACGECRTEMVDEREVVRLPFHVTQVTVPGAEGLEPLTVALDVHRISWRKAAPGRYAARAAVVVTCPCCQKARDIQHYLQAPSVLLTDIGRCSICRGDLDIEGEEIDYLDGGSGNWEVDVRATLVCRTCSRAEPTEIRVPVSAWDQFRTEGDLNVSLARLPPSIGVGTAAGQVFISYRRSESEAFVGRICERLVGRFGRESIVWDVSSIPYGCDFREFIADALRVCRVLLVVLGPEWISISDEPGGRRRIDDPNDLVRLEVEAAIERGIPIIPLFIGGAKMPALELLPESLTKLHYRNGLPVRPDPDFDVDIRRLIGSLEECLQPHKGRTQRSRGATTG